MLLKAVRKERLFPSLSIQQTALPCARPRVPSSRAAGRFSMWLTGHLGSEAHAAIAQSRRERPHRWFPGRAVRGPWVMWPWASQLMLVIHASLVAQMVKNLPTVQETWVWSLGQEAPLEREMAARSSTLAWRIPKDREAWQSQSTGPQRAGHDWGTNTFTFEIMQWPPVAFPVVVTRVQGV